MHDLEGKVTRELIARGHLTPGQGLIALPGGRVNAVWRFENGRERVLVCKLFLPGAGTPLFPNDASTEWRSLCHLAPHGLAPTPVDHWDGAAGPIILSHHLSGHSGDAGPAEARALRALHAAPVLEGVPEAPGTWAELEGNGLDILRPLGRDVAQDVMALRPRPRAVDLPRRCLLHGDPVAANIIVRCEGAAFVDWQCPALGDPVLDLVTHLSPSMRLSCELPVLSEARVEGVLSLYGDPVTTELFHAARPILVWRLACHAAWRVARGWTEYARGLSADLALLERLDQ